MVLCDDIARHSFRRRIYGIKDTYGQRTSHSSRWDFYSPGAGKSTFRQWKHCKRHNGYDRTEPDSCSEANCDQNTVNECHDDMYISEQPDKLW